MAFRLRARPDVQGGAHRRAWPGLLLLAETLALQGRACVHALLRLRAEGLQGLVTVSPFGGGAAGLRGEGPGHASLEDTKMELLNRGRALFLEARSLYVARSGEQSLLGCEMLVHVGVLLSLDSDRRTEAKACLEQALGLLNKRGEGPVAVTAHALSRLAWLIEQEPGREGLARLLYEEALNAFKRAYPTDHHFVTAAATSLGTLLTTQMRYDRAIVLYEEALAAARRAVSSTVSKADNDRARAALPPVLVTLAALHDKTGRYALAISMYRDAIACYREVHGETHRAVAETLCLLAACVDNFGLSGPGAGAGATGAGVGQAMDRGLHAVAEESQVVFREERYEEAQSLANEALGVFHALDGFAAPSVIRTLKLKARIHSAHGQLASAKACFEQMMAAYAEAQLGFTEDLAQTQHAFADLLVLCDEHVEAMALFEVRYFSDGVLLRASAALCATCIYLRRTSLIPLEHLSTPLCTSCIPPPPTPAPTAGRRGVPAALRGHGRSRSRGAAGAGALPHEPGPGG